MKAGCLDLSENSFSQVIGLNLSTFLFDNMIVQISISNFISIIKIQKYLFTSIIFYPSSNNRSSMRLKYFLQNWPLIRFINFIPFRIQPNKILTRHIRYSPMRSFSSLLALRSVNPHSKSLFFRTNQICQGLSKESPESSCFFLHSKLIGNFQNLIHNLA